MRDGAELGPPSIAYCTTILLAFMEHLLSFAVYTMSHHSRAHHLDQGTELLRLS